MQSELQKSVEVSSKVRSAAFIDLAIVLAFFLAANLSEKLLDPILRRGTGLSGVLTLAAYQFTLEGLAVLLLIFVRRESLAGYGFRRSNLGKSLALGFGLSFLYATVLSLNAGVILWIPFRRHSAIRMSLAAGIPLSIIGIAVTIAVWGFVEGLFAIFFARKLNQIIGAANRGWLSPGAIGFGVFNGSIHLAIGQGWQGFLFSFLSGYAIAVVPAVTMNAWGGTLVQVLTNAVGKF